MTFEESIRFKTIFVIPQLDIFLHLKIEVDIYTFLSRDLKGSMISISLSYSSIKSTFISEFFL